MSVIPDGFCLIPGALSPDEQSALAADVLALSADAPFYRPLTPGGKAMSVAMTNLGPLGWFTDRAGYRYVDRHPQTLEPWPSMPPLLFDLWRRYSGSDVPPDACLVNRYDADAKMGLHADADEADFSVPVLSISLGDTAIFRMGGPKRGDPTTSFRLTSGDVVVLGGQARRAYHGVDRIISGSSRLIPGGGRINLTMRRAASVG